jgi:hypothetical protein
MAQKLIVQGKLPNFDPKSTKLFQQRAVRALPLLIRQAKAEQTITYSALATELQIPNPRNLNHILGAVASAILKLSKTWKVRIPALNLVVVNKYSGLPGKGAAGIPDVAAFRQGTLSYRRKTIDKILHDVFSFPNWDKVLAHFGLKPAILPPTPTPMKMSTSFGAAAKETKEHYRLKEFFARNPHELGLKGFPNGVVEYAFPSADEIDVLFKTNTRWVGVEVKGCKSGDMDIRRGL